MDSIFWGQLGVTRGGGKARVGVGSRRWLQVVQIVLCSMQVLVTVKLSSLISLILCKSISCTKSRLDKNHIPVSVELDRANPQLVLNIYRKRFNLDYSQDTWVFIPDYLIRFLIKSNYSQNYEDGTDLCQCCVIIRSQH